MNQYVVVPVSGPLRTLEGVPNFMEIQTIVEGYYEVIGVNYAGAPRTGYVNEEGGTRFSSHEDFPRKSVLPVNPRASRMDRLGRELRGTLIILVEA